MHDGRRKVWLRPCERYSNFCVQEALRLDSGSVMVWAGITWRHRTPLVVIDGIRRARCYIDDVLEPDTILDDIPNFQQT